MKNKVKNLQECHEYDDIILLSYPYESQRPKMSLIDRAAQFSPFAALTGHDEAVKETARITDEKIVMSEDRISILSEKLNLINEQLSNCNEVCITYFVPDKKKKGGAYVSKSGVIKKMDEYERVIIMKDKTRIKIEDIIEIESHLFNDFE